MSTDIDDFASIGGPMDDSVLAGEYVLGLLDAEARLKAQSRVAADTGFARLVSNWEERLSPLLDRVEPLVPSPHVWPRIRTRLGWPAVQGARRGLWNNVGFWRAATGMAVAAGIFVLAIGVRPLAIEPLPPTLVSQPPAAEEQAAKPVVVLARKDGATGWIASIDVVNQKLLMVPVPSPLEASGKVNELWLIPTGEGPRSLGFVSNEKAHTIEVPPDLRRALVSGATLAITLEPEAGMPHAAPSGAVVAQGQIAST